LIRTESQRNTIPSLPATLTLVDWY